MPDQFCEKCTAESTEESAGNIRDWLFGQEFLGEARKCDKCFSDVRVLWRNFFFFPLRYKGCFRYKMVGAGMGGIQFISRRVADDPELIRQTRIKGILVATAIMAVAGAFIAYQRLSRR